MKSRIQESWEKYQKECMDALATYNQAHAKYLETCEIAGIKYNKIRDDFIQKNELKSYVIDRWYDKQSRSWVCQAKDSQGNQYGDAIFAGTKAGAYVITIEDFLTQREKT